MSEDMPTWSAPELTPRQHHILVFVATCVEANGWAPTLREIGRACGINSTSMVSYNLRQLQALGYVRLGGGARKIRIVRQS